MSAINRLIARFFRSPPPATPQARAALWRGVFDGPAGPELAADLAQRARLFVPSNPEIGPHHAAYLEGRRALALELLALGALSEAEITARRKDDHE